MFEVETTHNLREHIFIICSYMEKPSIKNLCTNLEYKKIFSIMHGHRITRSSNLYLPKEELIRVNLYLPKEEFIRVNQIEGSRIRQLCKFQLLNWYLHINVSSWETLTLDQPELKHKRIETKLISRGIRASLGFLANSLPLPPSRPLIPPLDQKRREC